VVRSGEKSEEQEELLGVGEWWAAERLSRKRYGGGREQWSEWEAVWRWSGAVVGREWEAVWRWWSGEEG
jgi:hypothetical protein